jgi:uncharacterized membrane protein
VSRVSQFIAPQSETVESSKTANRIFAFLFFIALAVVWLKTAFAIPLLQKTHWPETFLVVLTTTSVLSSFARVLSWQNVLFAACVVAVIGATAQSIESLNGFWFAAPQYADAAGPRFFNVLPWAMPLVWVIVIFSSRGSARRILRQRVGLAFYGVWLIGLTIALSVALLFGIEIFAAGKNSFWFWRETYFGANGLHIPLTHALVEIGTTLVASIAIMPLLIYKKPAPRPDERQSFAIWFFLNLLFATSAFARQRPAMGIAISMIAIGAALLVRRGVRVEN